jgi:hypothetical protein
VTALSAVTAMAGLGLGQVASAFLIVALWILLVGAALYGVWCIGARFDDWLLRRRQAGARQAGRDMDQAVAMVREDGRIAAARVAEFLQAVDEEGEQR